jgi:hypothetical protein
MSVLKPMSLSKAALEEGAGDEEDITYNFFSCDFKCLLAWRQVHSG